MDRSWRRPIVLRNGDGVGFEAKMLELSHDDVAHLVGATSVAVDRVLADLEPQGAIRTLRRNIEGLQLCSSDKCSRRQTIVRAGGVIKGWSVFVGATV